MPHPSECLTSSEQEKFEAARQKFLYAIAIAITLTLFLAAAGQFIELDDYLWLVVPAIFAAVINVIVRSWPYKCPRCNKPPMAERISWGEGVSYSSYVALKPRKCSNCGTHLVPQNTGKP